MLACKAYKYRLYPTHAQKTSFELTLNLCRELYNAALQERRDAYKRSGKSLKYYDQAMQLPAIKEVRPDLEMVHSQVLQEVLHRLDRTFKAFFARCQRGDKPGYPRFQAKGRYHSFTFPQGGWSLKNNRLTLSKIGTIKLKLHREVVGKVKTCTISREGDSWFVCFSVESEFDPPINNGPAVGIDMGLTSFANLSNGLQIDNPRQFRKNEKRLARTQRKLASLRHLPRHAPKKIKAKKAVAKAFRKVRNQRLDFAHKLSHELTSDYSVIVVEDLKIKKMMARPKPKEDENQPGHYLPNGASAKSGLAKSIGDAGWGTFIAMLSYKVAYTGSKLIKVSPAYTSQTCPSCGAVRAKDLAERWHSCQCGCELQRDIAAAQVILSRGLATVRNQSVAAPAFHAGE
jgi:putative transposase